MPKKQQFFRLSPELVKKAATLAKLDRRKPCQFYEIAVIEKIEREKEKTKRSAKII